MTLAQAMCVRCFVLQQQIYFARFATLYLQRRFPSCIFVPFVLNEVTNARYGGVMGLTPSELESFPSLEWSQIAPRLTPAIRSLLEKSLETQNGAHLSLDQACALGNCQGDDLLGLLVAANILREELVGNIVTYVVNRNINFTNICFVGCKFCAFSRGPRESDAYYLSLDDVAVKAREAWELGAREVCIQGGLPHDLPKFYYRDILRAVKSAVPGMHIHAFSPMEIVYGVELTGMPLPDYLSMLRDNGLGTLPGTAAEILDDEIRHILSANKLSTAQWIDVIRTAHRCGIRTTSTMMYGHAETPAHWVRQMRLLRDIQSETAGFTEFVPLGFVHQNTLLFHQGLARSGPTLAEHLKVHALARILLAGSINNIQVSWVKLNRQLSQLCLHAGANDYGGTLMEENISREAGATAGQYTSPEDFQSLILEIGRIPAERNTTYSRIHIKAAFDPKEFSVEHSLEAEFA
jgi:7,8-didemethyl-8-hydroxy-5-deazariboflavin synthase CofH subunit